MNTLMEKVDDFLDWMFKKSPEKKKIARILGNSIFIMVGLVIFKLSIYVLGWIGLIYLLLTLTAVLCLMWIYVQY